MLSQKPFMHHRKLHGWLPWLVIALALPGCSWFQKKPPDDSQFVEFAGPHAEGFCRYQQLYARASLLLAQKLRSGEIATESDADKWLGDRWVESRETAFEPAMGEEDAVLGNGLWSVEAEAAYREKVAYECDPSLKGQQ